MSRFEVMRRLLLGGAFALGLLGVGSPALGQQTAGNCTLNVVDDPATQPGGTAAISATLGSGTVTVTSLAGLSSLTLGATTNASVNVPAFTAGTTSPVVVTFTIPDTTKPTTFTLSARSPFHGVIITVTCTAAPPPPTACVLTQGYWKNHPDQWPVTTLTLGNQSYTQAQLLAILSQPVKGNGLVSLAHQLIAAKLNIADGATAPASVQLAIAAADQAIGNRAVPPIGNGSLSTSSVSGLVSILDAFNNGNAAGGPAHCDDEDENERD